MASLKHTEMEVHGLSFFFNVKIFFDLSAKSV